MGMDGHTIRLLPEDAYIQGGQEDYRIIGHSQCKVQSLLDYLRENKLDILVREEDVYGKSYLINHGIEMLIETAEEYVTCLKLRICFSWFKPALKECYEFALLVNRFMPIKDWLDNSQGESLTSEEVFSEMHQKAAKDKYILFCERFSCFKEIRLTENELYEYWKKRDRIIFKFKRDFSWYSPL